MNINGIYGNSAASQVANIGSVSPSSTSPASPTSTSGAAATATISTPGQLFGELQQLSQQNPSKFKAVAAQLASTFQNAASQATGPQAQFLTQLANQFTQASQTGTLQPPQGVQGSQGAGGAAGGHHHHHHHGGGGGVSSLIGGDSSSVDTAYQSALSIVSQATGSTPPVRRPSSIAPPVLNPSRSSDLSVSPLLSTCAAPGDSEDGEQSSPIPRPACPRKEVARLARTNRRRCSRRLPCGAIRVNPRPIAALALLRHFVRRRPVAVAVEPERPKKGRSSFGGSASLRLAPKSSKFIVPRAARFQPSPQSLGEVAR